MTKRIFGSLVIFVSILFLPYWIYIPLLFIGIILFPFFWEGLVLAFMVSVIHGSTTTPWSFLISPLTLSVLVVIIIILPIRENLRSYA